MCRSLLRAARLLVLASLLCVVTEGVFGQEAWPVQMPSNGTAIRLTLAVSDEEPAAWDGSIRLSQGRLLGLDVQPPAAGKAEGGSWKIQTRIPKAPAQRSVHDPALPSVNQPVLFATLDAPDVATISIATRQGDFSFTLGDLEPGKPGEFLGGRVLAERVPLSIRLTSGPEDEDLPAAARAPDGTLWVAYTAYKHGTPINVEAAHSRRQFDSLVPSGHGDQVRLVKFDGVQWSRPIDVTGPGLDVWRPSVAVDGQGAVWVVWSQNVDGNWDLYASAFDSGTGNAVGFPAEAGSRVFKVTFRLTAAEGADINPVAVTDPASGHVLVVWQGWREGTFDVLLRRFPGGKVEAEQRLSQSAGNQWCPAAVFDSAGRLHVTFDTYENGNYDVKLVSDAAGAEPKTIDVAVSPKYEARPSIAVDKNDRIWIAYEEDGPNWGKDQGMRWMGRSGMLLYFQREIVLRMVEGGRVRQAVGEVPSEPILRNYPDTETRRLNLPRLAVDNDGRVWLAYRRHPSISGGGEIWISFLTYHTGEGWARPARMANSENILDNRPPLVPWNDGVLLVHSTDARTRGTQTAGQNDLFVTIAEAVGPAAVPQLAAAPQAEPVEPVHPSEPEEVRRIRQYRAEIGGKTYQLLRGEFHRHTELTSHRGQDGTLEEMWRYGLDAAGMEWIGNGDHDNGYAVEYLWWLVQKQTSIYYHSPTFLPMFTYERSVSYPSGHRNAMFARRGVRPLPRIPGGKEPLFGTSEEGSPDIKTFYAYLRHFDGICASHTSGTNMGTDWRDNDPDVEPVVEIYQGLRHSYEHEGAPATAEGDADAIGGYRPAGFVWNALMKGYRLGFESSSDHYSTHISYSMVWAEETSREAILDGFKKRHCYGANDNIILDVRCGNQMMGDVFTLSERPELTIAVIGTAPIERLSIVRGTGSDAPRYVYDAAPNKQEVRLRWSDQAPEWGKTSYYYVRVEQVRPEGGYGALAWASPMWIELKR